MEFIVTHDGENWIARYETMNAEAPTLEELDSKLKKLLKEKGYLKRGENLEIFMAFDNSTIPLWIRQYNGHYFNRIVRMEG
ncbi:MAG: hypothetical protein GY847_16400 [Proteobacteria bacterium]|nr:hypothetical protein [Pseudomonadota bacterium]